MNIPFLWIKLNVYSLLILFLLSGATIIFFCFDIFHDALWKKIVFAISMLYTLNKAFFIMGQYQHKKEVMQRLISSCRERGYSPRLFLNYMDSLCMQRMVYLTLVELDMTYEYPNLKMLKKDPNRGKAAPAVAYYEFKDKKMNFVILEQAKSENEK